MKKIIIGTLLLILIFLCGLYFQSINQRHLCNVQDVSIKINQEGLELWIIATIGGTTAWEYAEAQFELNADNNYELRIYSKRKGNRIPFLTGVFAQVVVTKKIKLFLQENPHKGQKIFLIRDSGRRLLAELPDIAPDNSDTFLFYGNEYSRYVFWRKQANQEPDKNYFYNEFWVKGNHPY